MPHQAHLALSCTNLSTSVLSISSRGANSTEKARTPLHSDLADGRRLLAGVLTKLERAIRPVGVPHERATESNCISDVGEAELDGAALTG